MATVHSLLQMPTHSSSDLGLWGLRPSFFFLHGAIGQLPDLAENQKGPACLSGSILTAAQGPLPVPVPARAGGRRHPVSQAAPTLPHQPAGCHGQHIPVRLVKSSDPPHSSAPTASADTAGAAAGPPSVSAQAQMAAPNSAPRSDWSAPLFKIRTPEGGQELPVQGVTGLPARGGRRGWPRRVWRAKLKHRKKNEFHLLFLSHNL